MNKLEGATLLTVGVLALASHVFAQAPQNNASAAAPIATAPIAAAPGPSLEAALEAAQLAIQTCKGLDQKVGVTVVDSAGIPKVVLATDGATPRAVQSSTNKALTSLAFKAATSELDGRSKSDTELAGKLSANPSFNTHAGGLLITQGNDVIGAIGVGGAKGSEKDEACAKAALARLVAAGPR
jgi:uncharacterized protein GlcG (DUF336 family)